MSNRSQIITTQEMYLTAQKNKHMLNVELLLDKPVGVAEHPDIMETIELELGKMAEYDDKLAMLKQFDKNKYVGKISRFFLFKCGGWKNEYWIVDENSLQDVPKPREMIIKFSQIEKVREYVIARIN